MKIPFTNIHIIYIDSDIKNNLDKSIKFLAKHNEKGIFDKNLILARATWNYFFNWVERKRSKELFKIYAGFRDE